MKNYFKKFSIMFVMFVILILGFAKSTSASTIIKASPISVPNGQELAFDGDELTFQNPYGNNIKYYAEYSNKLNYLRVLPAAGSSIDPERGSNYAPYHVRIEGSNDGVNFTKLPVLSYIKNAEPYNNDEITILKGDIWAEVSFSNDKAYKYYAIHCYDHYGSSVWISIPVREIEFCKNDSSESISLDKSTIDLTVGNSQQLTTTTTPSALEVTWTSSDSTIATVDSTGKVTAVKEGQVTITAQIKDTDIKATCIVTVSNGGVIVDPPTEPTTGTGLFIELVDGNIKQYDVTSDEINKFISWYNNRDNDDSQSPYYKFTKGTYKDYVVHDKIDWFEIR